MRDENNIIQSLYLPKKILESHMICIHCDKKKVCGLKKKKVKNASKKLIF